jgi:hypothetical protein
VKFGIGFFPDGGPDRVSARRYFAERADALGYDSVKMVEHHFTSYGGYSPDPCVYLAACAQRAPRMRMVTGAVLPAFKDAARRIEYVRDTFGDVHASFQISFGVMEEPRARRSIELFARHVMPRFR